MGGWVWGVGPLGKTNIDLGERIVAKVSSQHFLHPKLNILSLA